uniref:Uncharacterized protein n=1 Tax=Anguilla anguilla TaxID=7936 RepID=A0A0E9SHS0_ANGAN
MVFLFAQKYATSSHYSNIQLLAFYVIFHTQAKQNTFLRVINYA